MTPGVVAEINVVEGQLVERDEVIARLVNTDAQLALKRAQAELDIYLAAVMAARTELANANISLEKPLQRQSEFAEAESALAQLEAEINGLPASLVAAEARFDLASQDVERKNAAGEAIAGRILRESKAELAGATAQLTQLKAREPLLRQQFAALTRKCDAARDQLEFKLDEKRRVSDAEAALKAAEARSAQSHLAVEAAQLELDRTIIRAPIRARILSIQATVGKRVSGLDVQSEQGSSAIATLYEPQRLQVRVDVRLEDVPRVQPGAPVRIETAAVPGGLEGEVISATSLADIQKNTLLVKVAVNDPPDVLRPEMLTQVTFLAPENTTPSDQDSKEQLRMLVPRPLVSSGEGGNYLWIADRVSGTARRQSVTLGNAGTDELVEVTAGITPTDRLVSGGRESLADGSRIRIIAEDASMGIGGPLAPATSRVAAQANQTTK
jgi:multidrug efflux pump subunit AcrA (membrane-fusion protein)